MYGVDNLYINILNKIYNDSNKHGSTAEVHWKKIKDKIKTGDTSILNIENTFEEKCCGSAYLAQKYDLFGILVAMQKHTTYTNKRFGIGLVGYLFCTVDDVFC